ncbi:MAG: hypothetical protein ABIF01_04405 [Candidatus Micrarchaeota archaeon]
MGNGVTKSKDGDKKTLGSLEQTPPKEKGKIHPRIDLSGTPVITAPVDNTRVHIPWEEIKAGEAASEAYRRSLVGLGDYELVRTNTIENLDPFCNSLIETKKSLLKDLSNKIKRAEELAKNMVLFTGGNSSERIWISFDWVKTGIDENGRVFVIVSDGGTVTTSGPGSSPEFMNTLGAGSVKVTNRGVNSNDTSGLRYFFEQQGISLFTEWEIKKSKYSRPDEGAVMLFQGQNFPGKTRSGHETRVWTCSDIFDFKKGKAIVDNSRAISENQASVSLGYTPGMIAKADESRGVSATSEGVIDTEPAEGTGSIETALSNSYFAKLAFDSIVIDRAYEEHTLMLSGNDEHRGSLERYYAQGNPKRVNGSYAYSQLEISSKEGTGFLEGNASGKKMVNFTTLCPENASWVGTMKTIFAPIGGVEGERKLAVAYSEKDGYTVIDPWSGFRGTGDSIKEAMTDLMEGGTYFGLIASLGVYYYEDFGLKKAGDSYVLENREIEAKFTHEKYADLDGLIRVLDSCVDKARYPAMGLAVAPVPIPHKMIPMLVVWGYDVLKRTTYDQRKVMHHLGSDYQVGSVAASTAAFGFTAYISSTPGGKAIEGLAGLAGKGEGIIGFLNALSKNPAILEKVVEASAVGLMAADIYVNTRSEFERVSQEVSTSHLDWETGRGKIDAAYYQALEIKRTRGLGAALEFMKKNGFSDPRVHLKKLGKEGEYEELKKALYAHYFGEGEENPLRTMYVDGILTGRARALARSSESELSALSEKLGVEKGELVNNCLLNGGPADSIRDICKGQPIDSMSRQIADSCIAKLPKGLISTDAGSLAKSLAEEYAYGYWSLDWGQARKK